MVRKFHTYFTVTAGLNEQDKILLEGIRLVRENDEIHFEFEEPHTAMSNLALYAE